MEVVENNEAWKIIDGFEKYEVSSIGRVRKIYSGGLSRILSPILVFSGEHYYVNLYDKDSKSHSTPIHKIVAHAFCDNPNKYQVVEHIDKNKTNNMFINLRWCVLKTMSESKGIVKDRNSSWRATWKDNEGKTKSKNFSIKTYGDDQAKALAIAYRKTKQLEFGY